MNSTSVATLDQAKKLIKSKKFSELSVYGVISYKNSIVWLKLLKGPHMLVEAGEKMQVCRYWRWLAL